MRTDQVKCIGTSESVTIIGVCHGCKKIHEGVMSICLDETSKGEVRVEIGVTIDDFFHCLDDISALELCKAIEYFANK